MPATTKMQAFPIRMKINAETLTNCSCDQENMLIELVVGVVLVFDLWVTGPVRELNSDASTPNKSHSNCNVCPKCKGKGDCCKNLPVGS